MMIWPFLKIDNKTHSFKDIIEQIKLVPEQQAIWLSRSSSEQLAKESETFKPNIPNQTKN